MFGVGMLADSWSFFNTENRIRKNNFTSLTCKNIIYARTTRQADGKVVRFNKYMKMNQKQL